MKTIHYYWFLFPLALVMVLGSVIVSCATDPHVPRAGGGATPVDLNTGPDLHGRVHTTAVLSSIRSVIVFDSTARSRRVELKEGQWRYNEESTELTFLEPLPFHNPIVHVEGLSLRPKTFVLAGMKEDSGVFVVLGDRLAVEGLEYTLTGKTLSFREDLDIEKEKFHIDFDAELGSSSFGSLDLSENDRFAYLEAEHRGRVLKAWYASRKDFWFLAAPRHAEDPPVLVKRPPTPEERKRMESQAPAVLKMRMNTSDRKLSRELSFPVSRPESVAGHELWSTFIEEDSIDGRLRRRLSVLYKKPDEKETGSAAIVNIYIEKGCRESEGAEELEFPVSEETLDMGAPVRRVRQWGQFSFSLDGEPKVVLLSGYEWENRGIRYSLSGVASEDASFEAFIRDWISASK